MISSYQDLKQEIRSMPDDKRDAYVISKINESCEETLNVGTGYLTHFIRTSQLIQALTEVRSEAFSSMEQLNEFMGR